MNKYAAVLYAMEIGQADLVAVKEDEPGAGWRKTRNVVVAHTFPAVPAAGVAVNDKLDAATRDKLSTAIAQIGKDLARRGSAAPEARRFRAGRCGDFEYVSTRGFYTPEVLPGGSIPPPSRSIN
jgi:ABC-type phosphate/phosphonate transport system substrate-binding protein